MKQQKRCKLANIYDIPNFHRIDYAKKIFKDGYKAKYRLYVLSNKLNNQQKQQLISKYSNISFTTCQYRYASEIVYDVLVVYDVQLSTLNKHLENHS